MIIDSLLLRNIIVLKYLPVLLFYLVISSKVHSQSLNYLTGSKIEDYKESSFSLLDLDSFFIYFFSRHMYSSYELEVFDRETVTGISRIRIPLPSKDTIE